MANGVAICGLRLFCLLLISNLAQGAYQSAGCSDEGCGIPCYLRPAEDECHYTDHGDSQCKEGDGDDLLMQLWNLNNTLVRLQEKLIQKGIIPAGGNCLPLPDIDHGGVIYTDLLISTGVVGMYVCENGYSLYGHGKYECAVDGQWIGNDTQQLPKCEDSMVLCSPLVTIPNGHIIYTIKDTTLIKPGEVVTYSCDQPYILDGASYRVCLNNGTWTDQEPKCIAPASAEPSASTTGNNQISVAVGTTFGIVGGIALFALACVAIKVWHTRSKHQKRGGYNKMKEESETTLATEVESTQAVETIQ